MKNVKLHGPIKHLKLKLGVMLVVSVPIVYVCAKITELTPQAIMLEPVGICDIGFGGCSKRTVFNPLGVAVNMIFITAYLTGLALICWHFYERRLGRHRAQSKGAQNSLEIVNRF